MKSCLCISLVASVLSLVAVDAANAGAIGVSALGLGKAQAAGLLFVDTPGLLAGLQTDSDESLFGHAPKSAEVTLRDGGLEVSASALVRGQFDISIDADAVTSNFPTAFGLAGPEYPFVTPIDPVPGVAGQSGLTLTSGNLGDAAVDISGDGHYSENGFLELAVLAVLGDSRLEDVANIVAAEGSVEKAVDEGSLPDDVDVLGKWRETDLGSGPGEFNFALSAPLTTPEVDLSQIMVVAVSHAIGAPKSKPKRGKVKICHKGRKLRVKASAVSAHQRHGDTLGVCP